MGNGKSKPILCIDFDGVIHSYQHGWMNGALYGHVTPGFFEWAEEAKNVFKLIIYSSRSSNPEMLVDMEMWLAQQYAKTYGVPLEQAEAATMIFEFADKKPPAWLTIDDRAICFKGSWGLLTPEYMLAFKPWNVE